MKPPRLVLLRPRNADNLGAIARAMKNFGLTDWVVVSPNPKLIEAPGLNVMAVKAFDLIEKVKRVDTLEEAVADCSWVVGTTMRVIDGRRRLTPKQVGAEAVSRGDENWAIVFGDERSGMSNEDLAQCHALSFIPSHDDQPSLNLAQAVVVYAYESAMAVRPEATPPNPALANDGEQRALRTSLELALRHIRFLAHDDRHAVDQLMQSLLNGRLTRKDAALWTAVMRVAAKQGTMP